MLRRLFSSLAVLAGLGLTFEGLAAAYFWIDRGIVPYGGPAADADPVVAGVFHVADAVFHPYVGYVLRAGREGNYLDGTRWSTNNQGYHNLIRDDGTACCDYPYRPAADEVVIGVFGGSVGSGYALSAQISGSFDSLGETGRWAGKRVTVLNFALPGFKQPQQLMALATFINLGQHFDIVIEIDGFNEAVTTYRNWEAGVEPTYPADSLWGAWGRMLEQYEAPVDEQGLYLAGYHRLAGREASRAAYETRLASLKLFYEAKAGWHGWRAAANAGPARSRMEKRAYFPTQARAPLPSPGEIWTYTVDRWAQASLAMADLARRAGAVYVHILQPNQWDAAFGDYTPIDPEHPYKWVIRPINAVYPGFRAAAERLERAGVDLLDLSGIFAAADARAVYHDDCCHYTQAGNEALFAATIEALQAR